MNLALNNLQRLICHKTQTTQSRILQTNLRKNVVKCFHLHVCLFACKIMCDFFKKKLKFFKDFFRTFETIWAKVFLSIFVLFSGKKWTGPLSSPCQTCHYGQTLKRSWKYLFGTGQLKSFIINLVPFFLLVFEFLSCYFLFLPYCLYLLFMKIIFFYSDRLL